MLKSTSGKHFRRGPIVVAAAFLVTLCSAATAQPLPTPTFSLEADPSLCPGAQSGLTCDPHIVVYDYDWNTSSCPSKITASTAWAKS
jgi:hypothetical protein